MALLLLVSAASADVVATGDVDPADPTTWDSSTTAYVGGTSEGAVEITGGDEITSGEGYIGYSSGSTGDVTIDGAGSLWRTGLYVGESGTGTISIANGGQVTSSGYQIGHLSGSTGTVTVDGADSMLWSPSSLQPIYIGNSGSGTLNIINDGHAAAQSDGYLGYSAGSAGEVNVDGTNSRWSLNAVYVGHAGGGSINISNGGFVGSSSCIMGNEPGTTGAVTLDAGAFFNSGLYIGNYGSGTLSLAHGSEVRTNGYGMIGYSSGSTGTVTVDGDGSSWSVRSLYVGRDGNGTMAITNGGSVESNGNSYIGYSTGTLGEVTVRGLGSAWAIDGNFWIGHSGSGTLNVVDGGIVTVDHSSDGSYFASIGSSAGATGSLTVDGAGSAFNDEYYLYVGDSGSGTMTITNGGLVSSWAGEVGRSAGSSGEVTVDGAGSMWTTTGGIVLGGDGTGSMTVSNGGQVAAFGTNVSPSGTLVLDGGTLDVTGFASRPLGTVFLNNGTLNAASLFCNPSDFDGTGTINAHGLVSDSHLVFSASNGSSHTFTIEGKSGQHIIVNLSADGTGKMGAGLYGKGSVEVTEGVSIRSSEGQLGRYQGSRGTARVDGVGSSWVSSGSMIVGDHGSAELSITRGGEVKSMRGYIGHESGSTGAATVDGAGSTWTIEYVDSDDWTYLDNGCLYVGDEGAGTLRVLNGGSVSGYRGYVGYRSGAMTGEATVDGTGSTLTLSDSLYVGYFQFGEGLLRITQAGQVIIGSALRNCSTVAIGVSNDNMLQVGVNEAGEFANVGTVALWAQAGLAAGTYTPISVNGTWTGSGTYEAFGGAWDETLHTFTVAAAEQAVAGQQATLDLLTTQRLEVDSSLVVNFAPTSISTTVDVTATALTGSSLIELAAILGDDELLQGAWDLDVTGLPAGDKVMLALAVSGNVAPHDLNVWHYDGTNWTAYDASDAIVSGGWAYFTVDSFSGYAVSTIPEPATMSLLALGGLALLRRRRR
jgi:T5SS/PEP-CTERM-associated repeat protein